MLQKLFRAPDRTRSALILLATGAITACIGLFLWQWQAEGRVVTLLAGIMLALGGGAEWLPARQTSLSGIMRLASMVCALGAIILGLRGLLQ